MPRIISVLLSSAHSALHAPLPCVYPPRSIFFISISYLPFSLPPAIISPLYFLLPLLSFLISFFKSLFLQLYRSLFLYLCPFVSLGLSFALCYFSTLSLHPSLFVSLPSLSHSPSFSFSLCLCHPHIALFFPLYFYPPSFSTSLFLLFLLYFCICPSFFLHLYLPLYCSFSLTLSLLFPLLFSCFSSVSFSLFLFLHLCLYPSFSEDGHRP